MSRYFGPILTHLPLSHFVTSRDPQSTSHISDPPIFSSACIHTYVFKEEVCLSSQGFLSGWFCPGDFYLEGLVRGWFLSVSPSVGILYCIVSIHLYMASCSAHQSEALPV